jgi:UDP-N-acetylglucosamine 2-epimerase (non-hydrolysing)
MKLLFAIGTRPDLIKMAPLIIDSKSRGHENVIVASGQHYDRELFQGVLEDLGINEINYVLNARGSPCIVGSELLKGMENVLEKEKPDIVLVHGDTFSALFSSIASALCLVPVGHVEAGLRTNSWEPFPEQICTRSADACSSLYFAATQKNIDFLLNEGHPKDRIYLTGNTIVDAVRIYSNKNPNILDELKIPKNKKIIYFSAHRRENTLHKNRMEAIFESLLELKEYTIFCSVLPGTLKAAKEYGYLEKLEKSEHIIWKHPSLEKYSDVLSFVKKSDLVLTDSGGMQEESVSLNVPCLTLRYVTDRPETVEVGANKCTGFKKEDIINDVRNVLENKEIYDNMKKAKNPYGDGYSSDKIISIIEKHKGKLARWEKEKR